MQQSFWSHLVILIYRLTFDRTVLCPVFLTPGSVRSEPLVAMMSKRIFRLLVLVIALYCSAYVYFGIADSGGPGYPNIDAIRASTLDTAGGGSAVPAVALLVPLSGPGRCPMNRSLWVPGPAGVPISAWTRRHPPQMAITWRRAASRPGAAPRAGAWLPWWRRGTRPRGPGAPCGTWLPPCARRG